LGKTVPSLFEMLRNIIYPETQQVDNGLMHAGWEQRDEGVFPALFGDPEGELILLNEDLFRKDFGRKDVHPFWLHHGVLTFPPTEHRKTWLYATSGMSTAFDSEAGDWSGLGTEFIMETKERADWAQDKLARLMAYNLLIAIGHYKDQSDMRVGSLVRLEVPIDGKDSKLTNIVALTPIDHAADFHLVTGKAELLQMVALSDSEADFIEDQGHAAFTEKLASATSTLAIDPSRKPLI
jgi:hypothetical protein